MDDCMYRETHWAFSWGTLQQQQVPSPLCPCGLDNQSTEHAVKRYPSYVLHVEEDSLASRSTTSGTWHHWSINYEHANVEYFMYIPWCSLPVLLIHAQFFPVCCICIVMSVATTRRCGKLLRRKWSCFTIIIVWVSLVGWLVGWSVGRLVGW